MMRRVPADSGFTLVEALVAAAIFALTTVSMLLIVTVGLRGVRENGALVAARTAVVKQMEFLRTQPADQLAAWNLATFTDGLETLPNAQGKIYVDSFNGIPDLLRLTVIVTVDGRSQQLVTLISR